jgi:hypothetical protein
MYITQFALVDFSCMTMLVLAPVAIVQKRTLTKLGTFRAQQNVLRVVRVNLFKTAVDDGMGCQCLDWFRFVLLKYHFFSLPTRPSTHCSWKMRN